MRLKGWIAAVQKLGFEARSLGCAEIHEGFQSSRPRWVSALFFKHFWHVVGDQVHEVDKEAFRFGNFDSSLAETLIVLIPKEENPTKIMQFRPISLCNVI